MGTHKVPKILRLVQRGTTLLWLCWQQQFDMLSAFNVDLLQFDVHDGILHVVSLAKGHGPNIVATAVCVAVSPRTVVAATLNNNWRTLS